MRNYFFFLLLVTAQLCVGCGNKREDVIPEIKSYYHAEFPDKAINLEKKLDEHITLLNKKSNDTIHLKILFDKASKTNAIVDDTSKDTIFKGKVYKYKGLHYFCSKLKDSTYWISAANIEKKYIQGLLTEWDQMYLLDEEIETNKDSMLHKLIVKNKPDYELRPDKKIMHSFYRRVVDSMPVWYVLEPNAECNDSKDSVHVKSINKTEELIVAQKLIRSYYPNPVQDMFTIETTLEADFEIRIFNEQQGMVYKGKFTGTINSLSLEHLPAGGYIVQLMGEKINRFETVKIVKI